jgi:tetratricopeptide (TPR) repeat protein
MNNIAFDIKKCMMTENWKKAKRILEKELEKNPDDHWLLTQLSEVYYELRDYNKALELSTKAIEIAPNCPLAINDYALHLYMHEKDKEAIELWEIVLEKGIDQIAYGECGEWVRASKSLLNDIRMRIGLSYFETGEKEKSLTYFKEHLKNRQRGLFSNFSKQEVEKRISEIEKNTL